MRGLKQVLGMVGSLVMVAVLVVVLLSTGGWRAISTTFHIGDPDASVWSLLQSNPNTPADNPGSVSGMPSDNPGSVSGTPSDNQSGTSGGPKDNPNSGVANPNDNESKHDETSQSDAKPDAEPKQDEQDSKTAADATMSGRTFWQRMLKQSDSIRVAKPRLGGYDRNRYFGGWANSDALCGSGTTRDLILKRDLSNTRSDDQCRVTSGVLDDPYTGRRIVFTRGRDTSSMVQIDHVVALLDAWASGARDWSQEKRIRYANAPSVLLASEGAANMEKGAGVDFNHTSEYRDQKTLTPNIWLPSNTSFQCDYVARRVSIKHEWGLSMSSWERSESIRMLAACVNQSK